MTNHDNEYQKETKNKPVSDLALKVLKYIPKKSSIIDLGAGAGNDSIYFADNGHNVIAIDRETSVMSEVLDGFGDKYWSKIKVIRDDFYHVNLQSGNVFFANYSLPFCGSDNFDEKWSSIESQVQVGGYISFVFFGLNDDWKNSADRFALHSKENILSMLKNYEILDLEEKEFEGKSMRPNGEIISKHWHVIEVIAKKEI